MENLCERFNVSILCCTEARITDAEIEDTFEIDGYHAINCYSLTRHTGGVVMYIRNDLNYRSFRFVATPFIWCLAIEITDSDIDGIYGGIYRNVSPKIEMVIKGLELLDDLLNKSLIMNSQTEKKRHIFMGDMNINFMDSAKNKSLSKRANEKFRKHNLDHVLDVNIPTRTNGSSATHIDVVVSNCGKSDVICEILRDAKITDHETIGIRLKRSQSKLTNQVENTIICKIKVSRSIPNRNG